MDDGFFIVLEVEGDLDIVGHDGREVDFADLDDISDEGATDAQVKGSLADDDRQSSVGELDEDVLALNFPPIFGDGLDVLDLDLDF